MSSQIWTPPSVVAAVAERSFACEHDCNVALGHALLKWRHHLEGWRTHHGSFWGGNRGGWAAQIITRFGQRLIAPLPTEAMAYRLRCLALQLLPVPSNARMQRLQLVARLEFGNDPLLPVIRRECGNDADAILARLRKEARELMLQHAVEPPRQELHPGLRHRVRGVNGKYEKAVKS